MSHFSLSHCYLAFGNPACRTGLDTRDSQESSPAPQFESINSLALSLPYGPKLTYIYMTTGKTISLTIWIFVSKVMSLLLNTLSRFVIAFLLRSKCFLISWLHLMPTAILEPKKMCKYSFDKI